VFKVSPLCLFDTLCSLCPQLLDINPKVCATIWTINLLLPEGQKMKQLYSILMLLVLFVLTFFGADRLMKKYFERKAWLEVLDPTKNNIRIDDPTYPMP
jgi:hypothetical protein